MDTAKVITTTVSTYRMTTPGGRHIRMATKVDFSDGRTVRLTEKMSKRQAVRQAWVQRAMEDGATWAEALKAVEA